MARVVRDATTARFRARLAACGVATGSPAGRAIGRTIAALSEAEELPGPGDPTMLLEPDKRGVSTLAHVRRVAGQNLWLWYRVDRSGDVVVLTLKSEPPA